jgi:hypothetical protein
MNHRASAAPPDRSAFMSCRAAPWVALRCPRADRVLGQPVNRMPPDERLRGARMIGSSADRAADGSNRPRSDKSARQAPRVAACPVSGRFSDARPPAGQRQPATHGNHVAVAGSCSCCRPAACHVRMMCCRSAGSCAGRSDDDFRWSRLGCGEASAPVVSPGSSQHGRCGLPSNRTTCSHG